MAASAVRRVVPLTLVGLMISAAAVAAALATPGVRSVPISVPPAGTSAPTAVTSTTPASPTPTASHRPAVVMQLPDWVQTVVGYVCGIVGVLVFGYLLWQVIRLGLVSRANRPPAPEDTGDVAMHRREAVLAAVDAGLTELASEDGDPRAAVIACWVRLEEVAAASGTPRATGDSAADLVDRLLRAHQVSGPVLTSLADLYRAARFGTHDIDTAMRGQARTALYRLRDELAHSRSGPLEHEPVTAGGPPPTDSSSGRPR